MAKENPTQTYKFLELHRKSSPDMLYTADSIDEHFDGQFGKCPNLGVCLDPATGAKVDALMRRYPTTKSGDEQVGLKVHFARTMEGHNDSCYVAGASNDAGSSPPFLENLRNNDLEVIYRTDLIDKRLLQQLKEFDGQKPKATTTKGLPFESVGVNTMLEELKAELQPLTALMEEVVGDNIEKLIGSSRMAGSPRALATSVHGWFANVRRSMKSAAL